MSNEFNGTLVVDLDGTLLRSDMLYESLWGAFGNDLLIPLKAAITLSRGKAKLKSYLYSKANIDPTSLPYDQEVINYIRDHRAKGGRTALVTASNQLAANHVAEHLQIFDEVHGSCERYNLIGENKARFLVERFGHNKFQYMGDSKSDLHVWEVAQKIITVNASPSLIKRAKRFDKSIISLDTASKSVIDYLKALRPHQWLKNILVFLPIIAGQQLGLISVLDSMLSFVAISLVASSVYILNDLLDLKADRAHPRKRLRPFASGTLPITHGALMAITALLLGIALGYLISGAFLGILTIYYLITVAYSLRAKRQVVLDICILASLYTIRIVAGAVATGVDLSVWLFAFSIFFFFSLAAIKRQAELVDMAKRKELTAKGRGYHVDDLPIINIIGLAAGYISVLVMALYLNSPEVVTLYSAPEALWGVCFVLMYWVTRLVLITHRGKMHDDPVVFAAKDRVSQLCFVIILSLTTAGTFL